MAQLGEHPRARELLRRAARGFGAHEELARARCVVAEAEVALAMRDLRGSPRTLAAASATLEARADRANALHARLIAVRRLLLLGRLDEAASALARLDARGLPPSLLAVAELAAAEVALRSLRTAPAQAALARAHEAAERARVPALLAEVAEARAALDRPAARSIRAGHEQSLRLDEVEALIASGALVIDACRRGLRAGATWRPLDAPAGAVRVGARARRGVAWRRRSEHALIARAFRTRRPDEIPPGSPARRDRPFTRARRAAGAHRGHRARLRAHAAWRARGRCPGAAHRWRSSVASGAARRRRGLVHLGARAGPGCQPAHGSARARRTGGAERVRSIGRARAQRWLSPPLAGFTTILLLPAALPHG